MIDTNPEAVAARISISRQIAIDAGSALLSGSLARTVEMLDAVAVERDRLAAENVRLRAALEPIRVWIDHLDATGSRRLKDHEYPEVSGMPCVGDLRRAHAALGGSAPAEALGEKKR